MLALQHGAYAVITDSGGIQVETTALGVPCVTLREHTEWRETLELGTNVLVSDPQDIIHAITLSPSRRRATRPRGWDGHAAERVADVLSGAPVATRHQE